MESENNELAQYQESKGFPSELGSIICSVISNNNESAKEYRSMENRVIEHISEGRRMDFELAQQALSGEEKLLNDSNSSSEERDKARASQAEIIKTFHEHDSERLEQEKESVERVSINDSKIRDFNWKVFGIIIMIGSVVYFGSKFKLPSNA